MKLVFLFPQIWNFFRFRSGWVTQTWQNQTAYTSIKRTVREEVRIKLKRKQSSIQKRHVRCGRCKSQYSQRNDEVVFIFCNKHNIKLDTEIWTVHPYQILYFSNSNFYKICDMLSKIFMSFVVYKTGTNISDLNLIFCAISVSDKRVSFWSLNSLIQFFIKWNSQDIGFFYVIK